MNQRIKDTLKSIALEDEIIEKSKVARDLVKRMEAERRRKK